MSSGKRVRRLTAILLFVPVALVLLAPPPAPATAGAELEPGMAGPGCPHEQESRQPGPPSRSEHCCHDCCVSLVAGTVEPTLQLAGSPVLEEPLHVGVSAAPPAEPEAPSLSERGPPAASSC
ncbi:MAG TPA: hypothetical protein VNK82_13405 [Terriglobales bacterium]|nr:hypothetical protein [Terriglobales bacterium]